MKYLISALMYLSSGLVHAECLDGEAGAKKLFAQEFSGQQKTLEVSVLPSRFGEIFYVKDPVTCGAKNCDFILAHSDAKKCMGTSYAGSGRVRPVKKEEYSEIILETSYLAVDAKKSTSKTLELNAKTNLFEEKVTK